MDFRFTAQQEKFRQEVREFCLKECSGLDIQALEIDGGYPHELDRKMVERGWFGLPFPEEYGGASRGVVEMSLIAEELARGGYHGSYLLTVFNALNVTKFGTEEQKRYYLPKVIEGKITMSVSMTEPNAGSDIAALSTRAEADGDDFVIDGQKVFSSRAAEANNVILLAARTDSSGPKHQGITLFLLPSNTPGVTFRKLDSLGRRIGGIYEVFLEQVRIPKGNLLGRINEGWTMLMGGLDVERAAVCAGYLGQAEGALDLLTSVVREKSFHGKPLGSYESIAYQIADLATEVQAAWLLTYRGVWMVKEKIPATKEISMAKLYVSELLRKLGDVGMELSGGEGFLSGSEPERLFRETRISTVAGGSSQILRTVVGKLMGLK